MSNISLQEKLKLRRNFILGAANETRKIHEPIIDLSQSNGALNPLGLGNAENFSAAFAGKFGWGQSTVGFHRVGDFRAADQSGIAYANENNHGPAEYGIVRSAAVAKTAEKIASLHGEKDALLFASGITAISTLFQTYPEDRKSVILLPEGCYFPTTRLLDEALHLNFVRYPSDATKEQMLAAIHQVEADGGKIGMIYLEAPVSQTFEIPDIQGIIEIAKDNGVMTAMDNTWASHVGFRPLDHGVDVAIQATTKYEGGYGDTPSGALISNDDAVLTRIARTSRVLGAGAVSAATCGRLYHRLDTTALRMGAQNESAMRLAEWFQEQAFVAEVIAPYLPNSPHHERFSQYFKSGNGLLTVVFDRAAENVEAFLDHAPLPVIGESWGGHVTLVSRCNPQRRLSKLPAGEKVRISVGLEKVEDIIASFELASPHLQ